jgi:hypothetical protein
MQQRRICGYFRLTCTHNRTFLCLPFAIRLQIYELASLDIFTQGTIDLNRKSEPPSPPPVPYQFDNTLFSLLSTCRAVYTELSLILYSTNEIFIRYQDSRNLQSLKNLSGTALSAICRLTVQLNITTSESGARCCPTHWVDPRKHSKPFKNSCRQHQKVLSEWASVASHVFAHIKPENLRFALICDVEDIESAQRAVQPLLSINSALAQCDIRLGQSPDPVLRDLACYVSNRATGNHRNYSTSPFRFMNLPVELRLQILNYTDIITPLTEVEWCPKRGFGLHYARAACLGNEEYYCCTPSMHYSSQFRCCRPHAGSDFDSCFCHRRHAAYSSTCHCWVPPMSLFLTCRALRDHAKEIFFSKNRFIITPSENCDKPATHTPESLEAFKFFAEVVPRDALRFLRFVEIVFPPFEEDYLRPDEPAYSEWLQTITLMKNEFNLPNLTLRVYMADIGAFDDDQGLPDFRRRITKEGGIIIFQMYKRIIHPLAGLKGLGKLFVHLSWPFARTKVARRRNDADPGFLKGYTDRINGQYERFVMGESYDSSLLQDPGISQWLEASTQDPFSG